MTNAKKIFITTESRERYVLSVNTLKRVHGHCPACGHDVELLSIDEAVSIAGLRTSELVRRTETNEIHAVETDSGHLLICSDAVRGLNKTKYGGKDEN